MIFNLGKETIEHIQKTIKTSKSFRNIFDKED